MHDIILYTVNIRGFIPTSAASRAASRSQSLSPVAAPPDPCSLPPLGTGVAWSRGSPKNAHGLNLATAFATSCYCLHQSTWLVKGCAAAAIAVAF